MIKDNEFIVTCGVPLEVAKKEALWGTFGKGGVEHCGGRCSEHQLRWVKLADCETEHLQMILQNQRQIYGSGYDFVIQSILRDRGVDPLPFSEEEARKFFRSFFDKN